MCIMFQCLQSKGYLTVVYVHVQVLHAQRMNETPLPPFVIMNNTGDVVAAEVGSIVKVPL